jgi:hypothetical protein
MPFQTLLQTVNQNQTNSMDFSPKAKYPDRLTAAAEEISANFCG